MKFGAYFQNTLFVKDSDFRLWLCLSCELFRAGITKVHLNRDFITLSLQRKMTIIQLRENEIPQARASVLQTEIQKPPVATLRHDFTRQLFIFLLKY